MQSSVSYTHLGIAKQLSPEIDVSIGEDENQTATEDVTCLLYTSFR